MQSYVAKPIPVRERLIFALDVASKNEALEWVDKLGDSIHFYKIGMELVTSGEYFEVLRKLNALGKKIFVDLKFFDVPATVAAAVRGLTRYPVEFCTIHGNNAMLQAAVQAKGSIKLLAVTALTSLDQRDLSDLGFNCDVHHLVLARAKAAFDTGCDGVVSSGLEVSALRSEVSHKLIVVCPGIRPLSNTDDQKRTVDARSAFTSGADYIVVGRPIRQAADPYSAALAMQTEIAEIFKNK